MEGLGALIYARTGNIFAILTPRSYLSIKKESIAHCFGVFSELLGGMAKFWGSKMKNIAFHRDHLVPILPFTPKDFISTILNLPGHFCWCQNWFTKFSKIGKLCVSPTVDLQKFTIFWLTVKFHSKTSPTAFLTHTIHSTCFWSCFTPLY